MGSGRSNQVVVTVVVDTREKLPYLFENGQVRVIRTALRAGDYSLQGMESKVAVERKSLDDFVSTIVHHRKRFYRELGVLAGYEAAAIVVEAELSAVLAGSYRSRAHPNAVLGSVAAIAIDFGVPVYFCSDRESASRFVEAFLLRCHKKETECSDPKSM